MSGTSRRQLIKGMAWAVPAVVATAAIPAYAASESPTCDQYDVTAGLSYDTSSYTDTVTNSETTQYSNATADISIK